MPAGLAARLAAEQAVSEMLATGRALDDFFAATSLSPRLAGLDPRDRALARSIATVTARRLGSLRKLIAARLERGLPKKSGALEATLLIGAAQLLFMNAPDHAVVDLAVRAIKRDPKIAAFAGLANAVLRGLARGRDDAVAGLDPLNDDAPAWLAARWRKTYGEAGARAIAAAHAQEHPLDLTVKNDAQGWAERLGGVVLPTGSVRLLTHAPVTELEGYEDGQWWVQDAAAALPARLLAVQPGERVADLCAAPGGKTAQLCAAGASVVAVDRSAERLKRLAANLDRLGFVAETAVADAASFEAPPFDAILLDAPCSATGTIRRHPDVAWSKTLADVASLAEVQARLLDHAWTLLKPGGTLVYATCSLEQEEGEQQIRAFLARHAEARLRPVLAAEIGGLEAMTSAEGFLRVLPCHLAGIGGADGFFAARLTKS